MKSLLLIAFCLIATSAIAQRHVEPIKPNGPSLNVPRLIYDMPNRNIDALDNLPGRALPAMVFPDELPGGGMPTPIFRESVTIDTNEFQMILHVDSSHGSRIELPLPKRSFQPLLDQRPIPPEPELYQIPAKK